MPSAQTAMAGRRRWGRLRTCSSCLCWFPIFPPVLRSSGSRLHGSHHARRTTVQPVQLSLMPDQVPAPPPDLIGQLPAPQVDAAMALLARLITRAAAGAVGAEDAR